MILVNNDKSQYKYTKKFSDFAVYGAARYISSSGLRLLLNIYKHVNGHGHHAALTGLNPTGELYEALELAGFFQLFAKE